MVFIGHRAETSFCFLAVSKVIDVLVFFEEDKNTTLYLN
jgi:hypothetical protein